MKNEEMKVTMITLNELDAIAGGRAEEVGIPRGGKITIRVKDYPYKTGSDYPYMVGTCDPIKSCDQMSVGIRVRVRV